ncbi:uncharacterized protein LOC143485705 [Brachyhypopomus gauderio]|uniref:uncharacterized protein LOC143485705 n=1 Tax=Brachyhypopomus gauderio TaxID=698409 RepID=UPI0040430F1A
MASKSRGKRTKQVTGTKSASQPLSAQLENKRLNIIPVGRQLQRTPPSKNLHTTIIHEPNQAGDTTVKPFIKDEDDVKPVTQSRASSRPDDATSLPVKEERKLFRRFDTTSESGCSAKMGDMDPETFIQGMQGYQWTETDLEFVRQVWQKKRVQQLQQEQREVEKSLRNETQCLELAKASRDKLQTELSEEHIKALKVRLSELQVQLSQKEKPSKVPRPQEKARRAPRTVKAQGTSAAPKAQKEENPKEKLQKQAKATSKAAEALGKVPKSPKMANSHTASAISKAPKGNAPKGNAPRGKAPKEKSVKNEAPNEKIPKDLTIAKESTVPRRPENAHEAAKPSKALPSPKRVMPSESESGPLRRSKRIALMKQSLPAVVPQKTVSSRRR